MKKKIKYLVIIPLGFLLICFSSCKREELEAPSPFGPAGFAILMEMTANPNVLLAGNTRQTSQITTTLTAFDGEPLANRTVIFEITNRLGNRIDNFGYFSGYKTVLTAVTNQNGTISLTYYGPLRGELRTVDKAIYIWGTLVHYGKEIISENTKIKAVRIE